MKTRAVILAGGEGTRLGVLTAKRTKPAVMFAGKYRIIDFPLSNCINSDLVDVMVIAQYRPQSLIEHIGAGGPWDLNRDFTGGVRVYTPYRGRSSSWFVGTADAIQQNFSFIKRGDPDFILILSGDHIYSMDYRPMIEFHIHNQAEVTIAVIPVPIEEASRYGIVGTDKDQRVTSFVEKPQEPPSNLANMGVYLFNRTVLDRALWEDHIRPDSHHDFGKDILPALVADGRRVFAFPYTGYWMDVGTVSSYWQAHMDLLKSPPTFNLYSRDWIIHTRTEERPPALLRAGAIVEDSLICTGCIIEEGAKVVRSILSPGVIVRKGATVVESILLTDAVVCEDAVVERAVLDKRAEIGARSRVGAILEELSIAMVGKNSCIPEDFIIEPGAMVGTDVIASDFNTNIIKSGQHIQTLRLPNEI